MMTIFDDKDHHVFRCAFAPGEYLLLAWPSSLPARKYPALRKIIDMQLLMAAEDASSAAEAEYLSWTAQPGEPT